MIVHGGKGGSDGIHLILTCTIIMVEETTMLCDSRQKTDSRRNTFLINMYGNLDLTAMF